MLVLRCTQKLLRRNPGPTSDRQDTLVPRLGNWHANLVRLARSPIVLFVSDISLLAVLVPGRDFSNVVSAFRDRLAQRLERIGLPEDIISMERAAMEIACIQPSNSKSVLGSMNDFVRHLRLKVDNDFPFVDANALEDMLSETPMGALKYQYPVEVAAAAFNPDRKGL
jgi:uncharacterized protein DUF6933